MKIKITIFGLLFALIVLTISESTCYSAPPPPAVPPPPARIPPAPSSLGNGNPNINGPTPGSNYSNGTIPNGLGQSYTMGQSNIGGFNGNPNINGPAPGSNINNGSLPTGLGQPYTVGFSNVGGINGNPNINGPAPGSYINAPNAANPNAGRFYMGNTNSRPYYPGGGTNQGGSYNQNWNDYTNPNGTVTYNTNVPNWWEKR